MEELPAGGFGLEHERFAPALTPPPSDEGSPDDEGSSSSTVAPNNSQEKQPPLISSSFQVSNSFSTSAPDAYIELNDLVDPNPPSSISFNYEDSDDYFNSEELLKLLGSESDET